MRYAWKWIAALMLLSATIVATNCTKPPTPTPASAEPETLSRTEFTARAENYFEYEPLRSGEPSQVLIHLTDLSDGSPIAQAEVTLIVRAKGSATPIVQTTSQVAKVSGIYVAELTVPKPGDYDIDFHIKNSKLDERMTSSNFTVE